MKQEVKPVLTDGRHARRKHPDQYRMEFETTVGVDFELMSEYTNASQKVQVRHKVCGSVAQVRPAMFLKQPGCRVCESHRRRLTPHVYAERFEQQQSKEFRLMETFTRYQDLIQIQHKVCGTIFKIKPAQIVSKIQCPHCLEHHQLTEADFQQQLQQPDYEGYQITYTTFEEGLPVKVRHVECGEVFEELPGLFLKKPVCPACDKEPIEHTLFETKLNERYQGKFALIGGFKGYQYPVCVQHTHPNCLKYSYPYGSNVSRGNYRCPYCERHLRKPRCKYKTNIESSHL